MQLASQGSLNQVKEVFEFHVFYSASA